MRRRHLITLLGLACAAAASGAIAQTPSKVYRVGFVNPGNPEADPNRFVASLLQGLAQRGYELDRNLILERRGAQFQVSRLPKLIDELTASNVDVIVTTSYPAAFAAKQVTHNIPVVAVGTGDPVGTQLVDSLARPLVGSMSTNAPVCLVPSNE